MSFCRFLIVGFQTNLILIRFTFGSNETNKNKIETQRTLLSLKMNKNYKLRVRLKCRAAKFTKNFKTERTKNFLELEKSLKKFFLFKCFAHDELSMISKTLSTSFVASLKYSKHALPLALRSTRCSSPSRKRPKSIFFCFTISIAWCLMSLNFMSSPKAICVRL